MKKLALLLLVCLAGLLNSCSTQCQISPPPTVAGTDKEGAAKIAAGALSNAITNGEISGNYKNVVNTTYVQVGQDDVAFYLLLQAYNCESSRRGHTQQAAVLLQTAREELARRHQAAPPPAPPPSVSAAPKALTKSEHRILRHSPLKQAIADQLAAPQGSPTATASPSSSPKAR